MNNLTPLAELDRCILKSYHDLGLSPTELSRDWDEQKHQDYLSSNPDLTPAQRQAALSEFQAGKKKLIRADISQVGPRTAIGILDSRVTELRVAAARLGTFPALDHICYGLIPGGGLDAYARPLSATGSYAIIVPEGLFNLVNLFCKLVVLLQPIEDLPSGPVYTPSASFAQMGLTSHPYIACRHRNLLESYFLRGDPMMALPYSQALPFQDRFSYLLVGTELYVLAHEAAHVVLGHLDTGEGTARPEIEFAADAWAVQLLTEYFRSHTNFPEARASLCAMFFHSLNGMWERATRLGFEKAGLPFQFVTHPPDSVRFEHFANQLKEMKEGDTPPWYLLVFNAIKATTGFMADPVIAQLLSREGGIASFHARVLPESAPLGNFVVYTEKVWWHDIAGLVISQHTASRRLGLWFLLEYKPASAIGLYEGVLDEDPAHAHLCQQALIAIEPMYEYYLPRLIEKLRTAEAQGDLYRYIFEISTWIYVHATRELHADGPPRHPMDPEFYTLPEAAAK